MKFQKGSELVKVSWAFNRQGDRTLTSDPMLVSQREGEGASHRREVIQFSEIQNLMFM
jgi:hypothetical protein